MSFQCPQCGRTMRFEGLCNVCRIENEKKAILALNDEELAAKTAEVYTNGYFDEDLCQRLINLRSINTEKIAEYAWEEREFGVPEVFKDASDKVTAEMIAELDRDDLDSLEANRLLTCLAHKGGDTVLKAFVELEKNPREWRKSLHVDPSYYANEGGWTYNKDGELIRTAFDKCFPIVKGTPEQRAESPVKIVTKADGACPDCGTKYINIIDIDGRDKRLEFLGIDGRLAVKCCPNCAPFGDGQFCRYDLNGGSEVIPSKSYGSPVDEDESGWAHELADNAFMLGEQAESLYYPCDWDQNCSAVGGFAFWIQDCIIKDCPDCGKPMMYLAQIGEEPLGYEGNFYIEICRECRTAAVLYQQT